MLQKLFVEQASCLFRKMLQKLFVEQASCLFRRMLQYAIYSPQKHQKQGFLPYSNRQDS
ncbi:hypothetical protein QUB29_24490 [Microcoleus sp. B4b_D2]|uniref:hypothetical protein n=1 Tax=unclassified Microcoleus TaxID=2642155 RepID=UPI002FD529A4